MAKKSKETAPAKPAQKQPDQKPVFRKTVASNNKARHEYAIEDTFEAGLVLHGSEVKSLRTKSCSFADCYARIYENECFLIGLHINTYDKTHVQTPDPDRRRKLLMHRREIDRLRVKIEKSGYTLVPLEIYFSGPRVKVLMALGKGKTFGDKRETLKRREVDREIARKVRRGS